MKSNENKENKKQEGNTFVCDRCEGTGEDYDNPLVEGQYFASCPHCKGTGQLDWIENILGKKSLFFHFRKYCEDDVTITSKLSKVFAGVAESG